MTANPQTAPLGAQNLYFAVWRWHFYAGLYVIPFMVMLAVTGIAMIWFTVISPEYGDRISIAPQTTLLSLPEQANIALATHPEGKIGQYIAPYDAMTPALFRVDLADSQQMIALNPYSGAVLRDTVNGATWYNFFNKVHGTMLIGDLGDRLIEIAASLGILLLVSGIYLVWPRAGGWRAVLVPNLAAKGRAWWKSLHAVIGFWSSLVLAFFLISGLAWTGIWGGKFVQAWASFPAEKWDSVPLSDDKHKDMNMSAEDNVPWVLEQTPMPASGSNAGITGLPMGTPATLETVVGLGRQIGFAGRFQVTAPKDEKGVWTLSQDTMSYDSPNPTADRTVHIDQYTGKVLASVAYADYSAAGKAMAVGVSLHEGQMGLWNVMLNIGFCLLMIFVAVSGAVMWWLRRPLGAGRLAAPPLAAETPLKAGVVLIAVVLSMAFPMLGFTLITVLGVDVLVLQNWPALKRRLG